MDCVIHDGLGQLYPAQAVLRCRRAAWPRRHRNFDISLDNVWYGRVALPFNMAVQTDSNELRYVECAMIVLFDYAEDR
jgi:hypothetical protein